MKLCSFISLFSFAFLCSIGAVQSMELENLSKKSVYGATSQSKPLQKMSFHPVGPGLNQTLNCLINIKPKCVEGFYINSSCINAELALPTELWEKIWGYLNRRDKLRLGRLSHAFEYIRQHMQLDVCREKLLGIEYSRYSSYYSLRVFYDCIKKIGNICEDTKVDAVKVRGKALLEDGKGAAQVVIVENEPWIKSQRHYTKTEEYQKLKYLKEVFNEPDVCTIWCTECQDELRDRGKDCLDDCRNDFCIKCKNELDDIGCCRPRHQWNRFCFFNMFQIVAASALLVFVVVSIILRETGVIGKNSTIF